jgi:Response regulators consisting of a CheY-like receiver domain and a winged-helix DNA-binding domain
LGKEHDILKGFSTGCDDYICKPFSIKEVIARVGAVLLRCNNTINIVEDQPKHTDTQSYTFNKLHIDFEDKRVYIRGHEVVLTKKENEILLLLTRNVNKTFSREDILKLVWKDDSFVLDRTVDVHIARLRKKLEEYGEMIVNRSGYGYSFQA